MTKSIADVVLLFQPSLEVLLANLHICVIISPDQFSIALNFVKALAWRLAHGILYLLLLLCEFILHFLKSLILKSCTLLLSVFEQLLFALFRLSSLLVELSLSLFLFLALAT